MQATHGTAAERSNEGTAKPSAERDKKRMLLREKNISSWHVGATTPSGSLDSSMKKNTGFIKKVRQGLGLDSKAQLIKEAATLNLDKYVDELVQAVPEGLFKCSTAKDCLAAAEILTELHSRFSPEVFAYPLAAALSSSLAPPNRAALQALPVEQRDRDETARITKQKIALRVSAELALVELIRTPPGPGTKVGESSASPTAGLPGQEWLLSSLTNLLSSDREHVNTSILITLLKAFGISLLGPPPDRENGNQTTSAADGCVQLIATDDSVTEILVEPSTTARFRKLCETYFSTLSKRITREHERLQEQDRRNHEAYIRSGEIFEDRQQSYEKMTRAFERAHEAGKSLSDLLGVSMPKLIDVSKTSASGLAINTDSSSSILRNDSAEESASGKSPWEDDDTRRFYTDLLDLKDIIPPAVLGLGAEGDAPGKTEDIVVSPDCSPILEGKELESPRTTSPTAHEGKKLPLDEHLLAGPSAQLSALLARLPDCTNRAMIDSAAVEFALVNSKAARNRLVKQLSLVPRHRADLLSYYARLVATLHPYTPDIGRGLLVTLDEEFRWLQKKKAVAELSETRVKNARFIAELTKFGVTPLHSIFHYFKVCLDDFSGANIEILATLIESCGRFLLRTEDTAERMQSLLEMLRRKRAAKNLDHRQILLLDNAYYQCNPPVHRTVHVKQRSQMELYMRHLVYDVLSRRTVSHVSQLLQRLHWSDPQVQTILSELFTRVWRIKFSHIHLLAVLLADLQPSHQYFVIAIVDQVCEDIRFGMETNLFKSNQRRVAMVVYLGELYNYRLVSSGLIFDQLWSFITFAHPDGRPLPGQKANLDAPDDYFRLRLVCSLLDCCGVCFDKGSLRKRFDEYLVFLNLYILSKDQPLPMDVDFMLSDTLEPLRPSLTLEKEWDDAAKVADEITARQQAKVSAKAAKVSQQQQREQAQQRPEQKREALTVEEEEESSSDDEDDSDGDEPDGEGPDGRDRKRSRLRSRNEADSEDDTAVGAKSSNGSKTGSDDGEGEQDIDGQVDEEEEEEEKHLVHRQALQSEADQEAEQEFARELAKMMTETHSSTSSSTTGGPLSSGVPRGAHPSQPLRSLFEQGVPFIRRDASANGAQSLSENGTLRTSPLEGQMRFDLLTKRGNKVQTSTLHLPNDSAIAITTREKQTKELQERKLLKEYVLGYEGREESEERLAVEQNLGRRGIRTKQVLR